MAERMHRTQILFPESEYQRLRRLAKEQRRSLGSVVRDAVATYYPEGSQEARMAAAREIASMCLDLPIQDWEEIEEELARTRGKLCGE